jgi:hypothetical protein
MFLIVMTAVALGIVFGRWLDRKVAESESASLLEAQERNKGPVGFAPSETKQIS